MKASFQDHQILPCTAQALGLKIEQAIDPKWLEAIRSPTFGFMHRTPKELQDQLCMNGVEHDDNDLAQLLATLYVQLDLSENPATKFACNNKIEK